ncbi:MAG: SDR family NAD(P)-dependent oxidoreductase, partial [Halioglobus sp.]|nr:SDR family NAD(P)-dependent oxidoreductase [Halioglobus sp.]
MDNANRTALVTGASAGLGKEFARQLAAGGYRMVLVSRGREALEALAEELHRDFGASSIVIAADLSRPEAPQEIAASLEAQGISVDYLVNNAGSAGPALLRDRDWREHQAFYQLMMLSIAHLCHLFIPSMVERGWGRVVNVAS